jgi:hypothetical protein
MADDQSFVCFSLSLASRQQGDSKKFYHGSNVTPIQAQISSSFQQTSLDAELMTKISPIMDSILNLREWNSLSGTIPASGTCDIYLTLHGNYLCPSYVLKMQELEMLDLSVNSLNGSSIPPGI